MSRWLWTTLVVLGLTLSSGFAQADSSVGRRIATDRNMQIDLALDPPEPAAEVTLVRVAPPRMIVVQGMVDYLGEDTTLALRLRVNGEILADGPGSFSRGPRQACQAGEFCAVTGIWYIDMDDHPELRGVPVTIGLEVDDNRGITFATLVATIEKK